MALSNLTKLQTVGIGSNIEVVGVVTTGQFKSGTSNLHSTGIELTNLNVSGIATIGGNLSIGGTLTYQDVTNIDSVGLITARSGVHIDDSIVHIGDTNTRIRFPSSDTITAETAGTERLRITSTGEVKIMNTSGTVGLYFQSSSGAVSNFRAIGTNNQSLGYFFGNSERVRFSSDGKVGIATDTGNGLINTRHAGVNQQVLHVRADLGSNNGRVLNIFTPDTDNTTAPFRFQTGNGYLFQCDSEDVFTIAHDRRIGIGTNAPSQKLEVQDRSGGTLCGLSVGTQYGNAHFGGYNNYPAIMNSGNQPLIYCDTNNDRTIFFGDTVGFGTTCAFRVNGAERVQIKSSGGLISTKGGALPFSDGYSAIEARAPEGTTQLTVTNTTYESGTFDNEAGIWFKGNYSGNDERAKTAIIHKNTGDYGVGDLYFCIDGNADNSNATVSDVKMKITKDGNVTKPSQVGFHASGSATYNRTSSFVPEFDSEYFDIGGGYNHTNYRFTAPVAGRYFLYFQYLTYPNADPSYKTFLFRKNGSSSGLYNQGFYRGKEGMQGNQTSQQVSTYIQLAENDYIEPYVEMSGGTFYNYMGSGHSHFWGFLVH